MLDSEGRFRLYTSPPASPERWIFAFSVTKDWKPKLLSDAKKIVENGLQPDAIIFVTNQFIHPEHVKLDAERAVNTTYGVRCEILDGQWMLDELYDNDYALAVEFLGCEPESDPKLMEMFRRVYGLREGGMSEDDALEYEQLKARVQYRNRYVDTPEHLVQDLARLGRILTLYEAHVEEALDWYREALPELSRLTDLTVGIGLLDGYFKALQKLPGWPERIVELLPKLIDMVFASEARGLYHLVPEWLTYAVPHQANSEAFWALHQEVLTRFRAVNRAPLGQLSRLYLDEAILYLEFIDVLRSGDAEDWLGRVGSFLDEARTVRGFPIGRMANALGILAPRLANTPNYEACFDRATELKGEQEGGFSKAATLRNRAVSHAQANQLEDAIVMATRAKLLWMSETTIRGHMLTTYALAKWYSDLGQWQAAEFELLEAGYLATWQPAFMEADIFAGIVAALATTALEQGRVLRAYRWMRYYLPICYQHRIEPHQEIIDGLLEHNLPFIALRLYTSNRPVHDRLVELADSIDPNLLLAHKEINLASDEEFEAWLADLTPAQQEETRSLRQKFYSGDVPPIENWTECDELAQQQQLEWRMFPSSSSPITVRITYPRDRRLAQVAFSLAVAMEIWSVFEHRALGQLTIADDEVHISVDWMEDIGPEPLAVTVRDDHSSVEVEVRITADFAADIAGTTSTEMINLFLMVVGQMLHFVALDDPEEVLHLLDPDTHGEPVKRISAVAHPAYLWNTSFAQLGFGGDFDDNAA